MVSITDCGSVDTGSTPVLLPQLRYGRVKGVELAGVTETVARLVDRATH